MREIKEMAQDGVTPGACDNKGGDFEVGILTLLYLRAQNQRLRFRLARNLKGCGKCDDVVFQEKKGKNGTEGTTYFLQLKHKNESLDLNPENFLSNDNSFDLKKYFHSYCEVKSNINRNTHVIFQNASLDSVNLILYTNGVFKTTLPLIQDEQAKEDILNSSARDGYKFSFDGSYDTGKNVCNLFNELKDISQRLRGIKTENASLKSLKQELKSEISKLKNESKYQWCKLNDLYSFLDTFKNKVDLKALLENLSDERNVEEFLTKFAVMHGQCSVDDLEKVIKGEIQKMFGTKTSKTNSLYHEVESAIKKWWQGKTADTLDEHSEFWKQIVQARVAKFSRDVKWKLKFQNVSVIKEKIPKDGSIIVCTECVSITCIKLKQALGDSTAMLVDTATLQQQSEEIAALWPTYCEVLLVQCENPRSVLKYFGQNARGTLIIICNSEFKLAFNDTTLLSELDPESQNYILQKKVEFQGHSVEFGSLLKNTKLTDKVNGAVIEQCLEGQLKVGQKLNTDDPHLIQRTLSDECGSIGYDFGMNVLIIGETELPQIDFDEVKQSCRGMTDKCSMSLFLNNSYYKQPIKWPKNMRVKTKYMQRHNDVRVIVITFESSPNQVVETIHKSFPYLEIKWFNRHGPLWVQNMPDRMPQARKFKLQADSFETLLNIQKERIVYLVAKPGMGKSTYFSQLVHIYKESSPIIWVLHIKWNDCGKLLNEVGNTTDKHRTIDFFWRAYSAGKQCSVFEKMYFKYSLEEGSPPMVLLLDGFDEVCPTYTEEAAILTKILCSETQVKKLWISTRPMKKDMLPQGLHAMCVSLKPLDQEESGIILCKLLDEKHRNVPQLIEDIPKSELEEIRKNYKRLGCEQFCLKTFVSELWSKSEIPDNLLTLPLHVCMLSTVLEKFMAVSSYDNCIYMPWKLNVLHVYDTFMNIKIDIYVKEKMQADMSNSNVKIEYNDMKKQVMDTHSILALYSLFSHNFLQKFDKEMEVKALDLLRKFEGRESKGIIAQVSERRVAFVHPTYAEYFAAHWLAINFKDHTSVLRDLFSDYYYLFEMLDWILCKGFELHEAVIQSAKNEIYRLRSKKELLNSVDRGGRTPLHLAAIHAIEPTQRQQCSSHLLPVHQLISEGAKLHVIDDVLKYTPIQYAYKCYKWETVMSLLSAAGIKAPTHFLDTMQRHGNYIVDHTSCLPGLSQSPLNIAITFGDVSKVKQLIEAGADVNFQEEPGLTPLHLAVFYGQLSVKKLLEGYKADTNVEHPKLGTPHKLESFLFSHFQEWSSYLEFEKEIMSMMAYMQSAH